MFEKIFSRLAGFISRRYKIIVFVSMAVIIFFSLFMIRLYFDNDMTNWVSPKSELGELPHYISDEFGSNNPILIVADFDDIFTAENLTILKELNDSIESIEGVNLCLNLANVEDITSDEYGIVIQDLIDYPLPDNEEYFTELKEYVLSQSGYRGSMINEDGTSAVIIVIPDNDVRIDGVAKEVKKAGLAIMETYPQVFLHFSGNPSMMNSAFKIIVRDLYFLVPIVVLVILGILFLSFRTLRGVVLPLITVVFSCGVTMGLMGLFNIPLSIFGAAIPVIVIAVGSAYGIHVMSSYYEMSELYTSKEELIKNILSEIGLPVLMAGLTTFFGFISLIVTDVITIQRFGLAISLGVIITVLYALILMPSMLSWMEIKKKPQWKENKDLQEVKISPFISKVSNFVEKRKIPVIITFLIITGISLFFSFRIESEVNLLSYLSPKSEAYQSTIYAEGVFGGYNPLNIYIKGDIKDPDVLKFALIMEERLKSYEGSKPNGISDLISELNYSMMGLKTIPETAGEVSDLWFFLEGRPELDNMVKENEEEMILTMMIPQMENGEMKEMFQEIETFINLYDGEFIIISNEIANPYLNSLVGEMLLNLMDENHLPVASEEIENIINSINENYILYTPEINETVITKYATSEESELILNETEVKTIARNITGLEINENTSVDEMASLILSAVQSSIIIEDDDKLFDAEWFSESLSYQIRDSFYQLKINYLTGALKELIPSIEGVSDEDLNYVFGPYLWKTIPAPVSEELTAVRTVNLDRAELTGMSYLIVEIWEGLFANQLQSIAIALIAVFFLNLITFKKFKKAAISLVAISFTIIFNFGVMGLLGIPLDFITAVIASVSIGVGIDYTIHFITRYSNEIQRNGNDQLAAYQKTLSTSGKAIIYNAVSVGLGFAVLSFSQLIPLRTLGLMLLGTMAVSSISSMTLLPASLFCIKFEKNKSITEGEKG